MTHSEPPNAHCAPGVRSTRCLASRSDGEGRGLASRAEVVKGAALSAFAAGLAAVGLPATGVRAAEGEGQSYSEEKYKASGVGPCPRPGNSSHGVLTCRPLVPLILLQVSFSNIPSDWPRTDTRVGTDELGESVQCAGLIQGCAGG